MHDQLDLKTFNRFQGFQFPLVGVWLVYSGSVGYKGVESKLAYRKYSVFIVSVYFVMLSIEQHRYPIGCQLMWFGFDEGWGNVPRKPNIGSMARTPVSRLFSAKSYFAQRLWFVVGITNTAKFTPRRWDPVASLKDTTGQPSLHPHFFWSWNS